MGLCPSTWSRGRRTGGRWWGPCSGPEGGGTLFLVVLLTLLLGGPLSRTVAAAGFDPYKILGVARGCSEIDVKKAYRKKCLKHHPDKCHESADRAKSEEVFKEIGRAYEVLSDENKTKLYDQYGEAALDPNFSPGFAGMGGPGVGGGFGSGQQPFPFSGNFAPGTQGFSGDGGASFFAPGGQGISIQDILEGVMGRSAADNGRRNGASNPFSSFGGFGGAPNFGKAKTQKEFTRPFYCSLQDLSNPNGCTKKLKVKNPGVDPLTGQVTVVEKVFTIQVKPGWKSGTKVKFKSQNGFPSMTFVLKEKVHPYFQRVDNDLVWKSTLSPKQAENGVKLNIPLPSGESLSISTVEKSPIRNGDEMIISAKGMPIKGDIENKGDLIIKIRVKE